MKEFNFTENDLKPIKEWSAAKDTEIPEDEWEIAYFLDGYNFGREKMTTKDTLIKELIKVNEYFAVCGGGCEGPMGCMCGGRRAKKIAKNELYQKILKEME